MYTAAFLTAKLADIGLVTIYFFTAAFVFSWLIERYVGPFDEEETKRRSTASLIGEVLLQFFLLGILTYAIRNVVERIPFPLEGFGGFQHARLKEVDDAGVFVIVFLFYQERLARNLKHIAKRLAFGGDKKEDATKHKKEGSGLGRFM